jgi:hypothetical protein
MNTNINDNLVAGVDIKNLAIDEIKTDELGQTCVILWVDYDKSFHPVIICP